MDVDTSETRANGHLPVDTPASIPEEVINVLTPVSRSCVERLIAHEAPPLPDFGLVKQGAVLIALFEKDGELEVVLTTRAKTMRRHPSQTALPGGKADPEDPSPYLTARREAFEEVNLPLDSPLIHYITTLEPVITVLPLGAQYKNHISVIPFIVLVSDLSILDGLIPNPEEVDFIFSHPLRAILEGKPDDRYLEGLEEKGGEWWPHEEEYHSISDRLGVTGPHRMHRFRSSKSPVKGLTSDILIHCATIAYGREPIYDRYASGQQPFSTLLSTVIAELPGILDQEEKDRLAGKVVKHGPVEWGAMDGGKPIRSGETWSAAS